MEWNWNFYTSLSNNNNIITITRVKLWIHLPLLQINKSFRGLNLTSMETWFLTESYTKSQPQEVVLTIDIKTTLMKGSIDALSSLLLELFWARSLPYMLQVILRFRSSFCSCDFVHNHLVVLNLNHQLTI